MIRKILVAMDRSEHAARAATWAVEIAGKFGAGVEWVHVFQPGDMTEQLRELAESEHLDKPQSGAVAPIPHEGLPVRLEERDDAPSQALLDFVGRHVFGAALDAAHDAGVETVATHVEYGDPASQILAVAGDVRPDLIVMGRRGLSDLQGLLMGSVAHKVASHADCACLTVK